MQQSPGLGLRRVRRPPNWFADVLGRRPVSEAAAPLTIADLDGWQPAAADAPVEQPAAAPVQDWKNKGVRGCGEAENEYVCGEHQVLACLGP